MSDVTLDLPVTWRQEGDIAVLMLGEVEAGRVCSRLSCSPAHMWMFMLLPVPIWTGARSHFAARHELTEALRAWVAKAGLSDPGRVN